MRATYATQTEILIGYAVDPAGRGIAYAQSDATVLRLAFRIAPRPTSLHHAAGYGALATVVRSLAKRGIARARLLLPDRQLVDELTKRAEPPDDLALAYVRVRCALNAMQHYEVEFGASADLMQRARAEVALNLAA